MTKRVQKKVQTEEEKERARALREKNKYSVEHAWKKKGERGACEAAIVKYARVIDQTESSRDMKPLISGMFEMIDRLKAIVAQDNKQQETPLFKVMNSADRAVNE